jgi:ribulose-5-phosphate 4-epimerase/fuculose-1-phosphate aldolase
VNELKKQHNQEIKELVKLCKTFSSPNYVQGAGGNLSIKSSEKIMLIKSSGFRLDEVSSKKGISQVNLNGILSTYNQLNISDEDAGNTSLATNHISGERPSMETSFHSYSNKYTIHLHPVHMLLLLCSTQGKSIIASVASAHSWVDYARPGHELSIKIRDEKAFDTPSYGKVMLANHGIIVTGDSSSECTETIQELEKRVLRSFSTYNDFTPFSYKPLKKSGEGFINSNPETLEFINNKDLHGKYLFPDAVVFMNRMFEDKGNIKMLQKGIYYGLPRSKAENINEIIAAHIYLTDMIQKCNLTPAFLTEDHARALDSMAAEEYRRKKAGI